MTREDGSFRKCLAKKMVRKADRGGKRCTNPCENEVRMKPRARKARHLWIHVMVIHRIIHIYFWRKERGEKRRLLKPRSIVDDRGKKGRFALTLSEWLSVLVVCRARAY